MGIRNTGIREMTRTGTIAVSCTDHRERELKKSGIKTITEIVECKIMGTI